MGGIFSDLYPQSAADTSDRRDLRRVGPVLDPLRVLVVAGGFALVTLAALLALGGSRQIPAIVGACTLLIGTCVAVSFCLRNPSWMLFALVLEETLPYLNIIPIDPETRWFLRYPLLLPICIPAAWRALRIDSLWRGCFKAHMFFFGWAALTVLYSPIPSVSAGRLAPCVLAFLAMVFVSGSIASADDVQLLLRRFLIGCAMLQLMLAISLLAFPSDLVWLDDGGLSRFSGIFSAPNEVGGVAIATIGAALAHWSTTRGWWRRIVATMIASSILFGVMADSRSVFTALIVGCSAFAVWKYRFRGAAAVLAIGLSGSLLVASSGRDVLAYFNRDVDTMTGRTEAWSFEVGKLKEAPILGYGYGVEGEIFQDRHFTNWEEFWARGSNVPLHNSYMSIAIGVGLPALIAWLVFMLAPWVTLMRSRGDPWNLKPLFFFVVVPMLVMGLDESGLGEPRYLKGLLFFGCWMVAEQYRQIVAASQAVAAQQPKLSPLAAAIAGGIGAVMIAVAASSRAYAADYYVDAIDGSDAASGTTSATAWRSLHKVDYEAFQSGDLVMLKRSQTWREVLQPMGPGKANFRGVKFTAYGSGEPPTINGSDVVSRWSREAGSVWGAPEDDAVFNVFADQAPGWGLKQACCLPGSRCAPNEESSESRSCAIGPMIAGSWYWSGASAIAPARPHTLYVWLPDGSDPSTHVIEAVTRPYGILGYAQGAQVDGIVIDGLRIVQTGKRAMSFESEDAAGCCGSSGFGRGRGITGLIIRNCVVARTGTGRIDDGSYDNAISLINATAPVVENNLVSYAGNHGNAIQVQNANGARVIGNRVDHWNHNGIDIKGSREVMVQDNFAHDEPRIGAGFYTEFSREVRFVHNRALRVSNGFQISEESTATILDNNLQDAGTGIYFGPRALSARVQDNLASATGVAIEGDGKGSIDASGNDWGANAKVQLQIP